MLDELAVRVDAARVEPVLGGYLRLDIGGARPFLLSGEYDYSCPPQDTELVASLVRGSCAEVMPGLGHFPMSENYAEFRPHLLPILARAAELRQAQL
jgi:pimeloyl-ACP methyl ester carboxylesterase